MADEAKDAATSRLSDWHFVLMLALAAFLHAAGFKIYSAIPKEQVMMIPVRVLNIKLGGGMGLAMPPAPAPVERAVTPALPPVVVANEPPRAVSTLKQAAAEAAPEEMVIGKKDKVKKNAKQAEKSRGDQAIDNVRKALEARGAAMEKVTPSQYVRIAAGARGDGVPTGAGSPEGNSMDADAEVLARYEQLISGWIEKHKTYPEDAKRQGVEGEAVIRLRINRSGKILFYSFERVTGSAALDNAIVQMILAADPVPPVPNNYPAGDLIEFLIPVSFKLQ